MSLVETLTTAERDLLRVLTADLHLGRDARLADPWRLFYVNLNAPEHALRFSPELVDGLIGRGLIYITQASWECPPLNKRIPFSCRLTREGENARASVLAETRRPLRWAA